MSPSYSYIRALLSWKLHSVPSWDTLALSNVASSESSLDEVLLVMYANVKICRQQHAYSPILFFSRCNTSRCLKSSRFCIRANPLLSKYSLWRSTGLSINSWRFTHKRIASLDIMRMLFTTPILSLERRRQEKKGRSTKESENDLNRFWTTCDFNWSDQMRSWGEPTNRFWKKCTMFVGNQEILLHR